MPSEPKPPTERDKKAAADALAARVDLGRRRALAFGRATQGTGKPGCRHSYPMPKRDDR